MMLTLAVTLVVTAASDNTFAVTLIIVLAALVTAFSAGTAIVLFSLRSSERRKERLYVPPSEVIPFPPVHELEDRYYRREPFKGDAADSRPSQMRMREDVNTRALSSSPAFRAWEEANISPELSRAQRIEGWAEEYRRSFSTDPQVTDLRILTMSWPLNLVEIYVQLRLHQQTRPEMIDPGILQAQDTHDPDLLLRADRLQLERRVSTAIDPADAIRLYQRCVILGDPGTGKTTLLKYLAIRCAQRKLRGLSDVPIHIDLNVFVQQHQSGDIQPESLLAFAAQQWSTYGFPEAEALSFMQSKLETGNALVLLDGLDETAVGSNRHRAERTYEHVAAAIGRMAQQYQNAFIVVTCRTAGYQQRVPLVDFTELEVLGFRSQDIERFVNNWFTYLPRIDGKALVDLKEHITPQHAIAQLRDPRLQALASSPLLLALIMIIYQQQRNLPNRRAELYGLCIELLIERWDQDRQRNRFLRFTRANKESLLKKVAWHFHEQRSRYFREEELLAVIAGFLEDAKLWPGESRSVLEEITFDSGLLKRQAAGWYGFLHLTLQEYFVAQAAVEDHEKYERLLGYTEDPWWEEVILLYVASASEEDANALVEGLWEKGGYNKGQLDTTESLFHTNLILVGQCVAALPKKNKNHLRQEIIDRLLNELTCTNYSLTRKQLATTLVALGEERMPLNQNSSISYRYRDVQDGYRLDEALKEQLFRILSDEDTPLDKVAVQLSLARALGAYADEKMAKELIDLLFNEQIDPEVRIAIAQELGISGMQSLAGDLAKVLSGRFVDRDVLLSVAAALSPLIDDAVIPQLGEMLRNPRVDLNVRCALIESVGASGRRAALPYLQQVYPMPPSPFPIHWHAIIAMVALGDYRYLQTLLPMIQDKTKYAAEMRRKIVTGLSVLRLSSLSLDFLPLLSNENIEPEVRISVVGALAAIADRSILSQLLTLLADSRLDDFVRAAIASLIGSLGDARFIEPLRRIPVNKHECPRVYRSMVVAIGMLGQNEVVPDLLVWLKEKNEEISFAERLTILDTLSKLRHPSLLKALIFLVQSTMEDKEMRQQIISILPLLALEPADIREILSVLEALLYTPALADEAHRSLWLLRKRRQMDTSQQLA